MSSRTGQILIIMINVFERQPMIDFLFYFNQCLFVPILLQIVCNNYNFVEGLKILNFNSCHMLIPLALTLLDY
jgi:hypothetical protein